MAEAAEGGAAEEVTEEAGQTSSSDSGSEESSSGSSESESEVEGGYAEESEVEEGAEPLVETFNIGREIPGGDDEAAATAAAAWADANYPGRGWIFTGEWRLDEDSLGIALCTFTRPAPTPSELEEQKEEEKDDPLGGRVPAPAWVREALGTTWEADNLG